MLGQGRERDHPVARDRRHAVVEGELVALVGERPDEPDLAAHVVALDEQGRADDEDVDPEDARELGGLAVDPAIDVDLAAVRLVAEHVARRQELGRGDVLHELLAAEARFDGHDQDDVEELGVGLQRGQRRRRPDRQTGRATGGPDRGARVGSIASSISTWNVIESQPASRYSSR